MNAQRHVPVPSGSDPPPQLDRALAIMRDMKDEYDSALAENKSFLAMRHEYHIKFEAQLRELEHVERSLVDLEATHSKFKADADAEIAHLKAQLAHQRQTTTAPSPPTGAPPGPSAPTSSALPTGPSPSQSDTIAKDSTDNNGNSVIPNQTSTTPPRPANGIPSTAPQALNSSALTGSAPLPSSTSAQPDTSSSLPMSQHRLQSQHQPISSMHPITHPDPINPNPANPRPLPSSLPAPLSSNLARSHPGPEPVTAHAQHQQPYGPPLQPGFSVSRSIYQPAHSRLQHTPHHMQQQQHPQQQPHQYPTHHPQHPEQMSVGHQSKFPRLSGPPHLQSHQLQISHNTSGPLPSPGSLAGAPSTIPSMISSAAPNGPRHGGPRDTQPMGLMSNGPGQHPDDRLGHLQGKMHGRVEGLRGGPTSMLASTTRTPPSAMNPSSRQRHPALTNADDPTRIPPTDEDWGVMPGRGADGAVVNMNVSLQHSYEHDSVVCCVRYSWDGRFLATGSNRSAQIFDASSGQGVAKFVDSRSGEEDETGNPPDSYVRAVCFSPNGEWLITGAEDHVVKVWDVRNRVVKHRLVGHGTDIYSVDSSANGRFIISGSGDKKAKLWSLENGDLLNTLGDQYGPKDGITSVSVSPTSQHVAAGSLDKIVRVWDVESGGLVRQFEGHKDSVYSVAFSPDGRTLLSGSLDKTLKLWDLAAQNSQCRLSFAGHKDFVLSVAFSPEGRWLISGSKDRTVQFWDPRQSTMCLTLQGHKNSIISIAHNPLSKFLATGSGDCRARTWLCD